MARMLAMDCRSSVGMPKTIHLAVDWHHNESPPCGRSAVEWLLESDSQHSPAVPDRVLVADVPGNTFTNLHCFAEPGGKEGFTAGLLGKTTKHLSISVGIARVKQPDGVNHGTRLFGHL